MFYILVFINLNMIFRDDNYFSQWFELREYIFFIERCVLLPLLSTISVLNYATKKKKTISM